MKKGIRRIDVYCDPFVGPDDGSHPSKIALMDDHPVPGILDHSNQKIQPTPIHFPQMNLLKAPAQGFPGHLPRSCAQVKKDGFRRIKDLIKKLKSGLFYKRWGKAEVASGFWWDGDRSSPKGSGTDSGAPLQWGSPDGKDETVKKRNERVQPSKLSNIDTPAHGTYNRSWIGIFCGHFFPAVITVFTYKTCFFKLVPGLFFLFSPFRKVLFHFLICIIKIIHRPLILLDARRFFELYALVATEISTGDKKMDLTLEGYQFHVHESNFSSNIDQIQKNIEQAKGDLIVFPEASISGFSYRQLNEIAEASQRALEIICQTARKKNVGVLLPLLVKERENFYNRQFFIHRDGSILATYDKIHLIGVLHEDRYLKPGKKPVVVDFPSPEDPTRTIRIGLATCYDLRFPELFRTLTLDRKAEVFLLPAMWPVARKTHLEVLSRARAIENQTPLLVVNATGKTANMELCGSSMAIDEKGAVVDQLDEFSEGSIQLPYSREKTNAWRKSFPALYDRVIY